MVKKIINISFFSLLIIYILWEIYWFNQVGLSFIKWHTHLMLPTILFLIIYYVLKQLKTSNKTINLLFISYISIFLFESFVQISGIGKTLSEKNYGIYALEYKHGSLENYYHVSPPNTNITITNRENVVYKRQTNSLGYSDIEWNIKKDTNEIRILCIGDSFTEGDGTPIDSTYVKLLEENFHKNGYTNVNIMNAGKCGSDPFFGYMNYKDRLTKYKPDIILQTIFTQDWDDINKRGGLNRFLKSYKLSYQEKNKYIRFLFAISYFSRPFIKLMGYNDNVLKAPIFNNQNEMNENIIDLFRKYNNLANQNEAKLILITFPLDFEIKNGYKQQTEEIIKILAKEYKHIDLLPDYRKKIYNCVEDYYWKWDGHHNSKGYKLMADKIYDRLIPLI